MGVEEVVLCPLIGVIAPCTVTSGGEADSPPDPQAVIIKLAVSTTTAAMARLEFLVRRVNCPSVIEYPISGSGLVCETVLS